MLAGHCLDFADSALPYLPISEITGRISRELPDTFDEVAERHPALLRLLPGQRMLSQATDPESVPADQAALFDAVHALAEAVGREGPLLLVVEDLHWADQSTRDLIELPLQPGLRRPRSPWSPPTAPTTSTAVTRSAARSPSGRGWPASSASRSSRCLLPTYAASSTSSPRSPSPRSGSATSSTRAEGNAFFVEELVGASSARNGGIPEDLADVLLVRLEGLDDAARSRWSGPRPSPGAGSPTRRSAPSSSSTPAELDRAVRDAVEGHVLVPSRDDFYQFRHALLAEAVYDDLLPGERTGSTRRTPEALQEGRASGTAAELARHARLAKDYATALTASLRAGDDARGVGGAEEAAFHYLQALELWHDTRAPEGTHLDYPRLVGLVADALIAAGHPARALGVVREQLDHLPPDTDDAVRGQLLGVLAGALAMTETTGRPDGADPPGRRAGPRRADERARQGAGGARPHPGPRRPGRGGPRGRRWLPSRWPSGSTCRAWPATSAPPWSGSSGASRPSPSSRRCAPRSTRRRAAGAANAELRGLLLLGHHHLDRGEFAEADEAFQRGHRPGPGRRHARGCPTPPRRAGATRSRSKLQGRWDESLRVLDIERESPPPIYRALLTATRAEILAARGDARGRRPGPRASTSSGGSRA